MRTARVVLHSPARPYARVKTRNDTGAARTYSSAGVYRARGAEVCVCE